MLLLAKLLLNSEDKDATASSRKCLLRVEIARGLPTPSGPPQRLTQKHWTFWFGWFGRAAPDEAICVEGILAEERSWEKYAAYKRDRDCICDCFTTFFFCVFSSSRHGRLFVWGIQPSKLLHFR